MARIREERTVHHRLKASMERRASAVAGAEGTGVIAEGRSGRFDVMEFAMRCQIARFDQSVQPGVARRSMRWRELVRRPRLRPSAVSQWRFWDRKRNG